MLCQLIPALDKFCFINFCCFLKYFLVVGIKSNLLHGTRNLQLNYTPNPFSFWVFHLKLRKSCDFFFHTLMTYWNCCSVDKAFSGYCFISIYFFLFILHTKSSFLSLLFSYSHSLTPISLPIYLHPLPILLHLPVGSQPMCSQELRSVISAGSSIMT